MSERPAHFYEFGPFRLDAVKRVLLREGQPVPLTPKAFETLLVLIQNSGRVMGKDDLMQLLWPDSFIEIEEANLSVNISTLRKALGESRSEHRYIVTVPGRGYRFAANVREWWDEGTELIVQQRTRASVVIEQEEEQEGARGREGEGARGEQAKTSPDLLSPPASLSLPLSSSLARRRRPGQLALVVSVALVGLGAALAYWWFAGRQPKVGDGAVVRSIAVLPFKLLSSDGGDEYLGLGMADALITKLGNLSQVAVRPTSAVRRYTGLEPDPVKAGRELKVDSVLEGSIQKSDEQIRVTVQLVKVEDGRHLWAEKFDERFTGIFAIEDSISERVAVALALKLTGEERRRLTRHHTENTEAYQLYLKGRYHWNKRTPDSLKKGVESFQQAIDKDPGYASAYAGLADSYTLLGIQEVLFPKDAFQKARAAAAKALEIDDTLAEAHASLAHISLHGWDWANAEREFKRAVELNPNYATAHHWYAEYLTALGRMEEAIAEEKRSQEMDPLSLVINTDVGWHLYYARRYDQAIEQYRKTLELDPNFTLAHLRLGQAYEQKQKYAEAIAELNKALALSAGSTETVSALGHAYALSGQKAQAQKALDELKGRAQQGYASAYFIAAIYAGLGERDQAFAWLEKAYEDRSGWLIFIKAEPKLDSLRSDPRFTDLLRRIGLAP